MSHTFFHDDDLAGKTFDFSLLKRFMKYARPYRVWIFLAMLLFLADIAMDIVGPMVFGAALDGPVRDRHWHQLLRYTGVFCGSVLLLGVFWFMALWITSWIGQKILFDLRTQLFAHLQRLPVSFYDRTPVGRLMVRVTNDVENLNEFFTSGLVIVFGDLFLIVALLTAMLILNWKMTLVCMAILPFLVTAVGIFRNAARALYSEMRKKIASLNSYLQENISGMQTVQIFNRESRNFDRYGGLNGECRDVAKRAVLAYSLFYPCVDLLSTCSLALLVWYAGGEILSNAMTFGQFFIFWYFTQKLFQPIRELSEKYNILQAALASSERIFKLMDTPAEEAPRDPICDPPQKGSIEFQNVTFSYNSSPDVLQNFSFHVRPSERVGIVGFTGAGKTTIVNLLTGLYPVTSGKILVDGTDIRSYDPRVLRRSIGVVMQDVFLFSGTVEENIRLRSESMTLADIERATQTACADAFIDRLPGRYDTYLGERGASLSNGQKQMLSFARALAVDPRILILDEATSNVDPETESWIQQALENVIRDRTALVIAHRLSTIQKMDRILVLHKGSLIEEGTHEHLIRRGGLYAKLIKLLADDRSIKKTSEIGIRNDG